jgi:hypothetical protein
VVLHRLDHHGVLAVGPRHLHAPGAADAGVGHVAVAADLVRGVDHHHPLLQIVGQHPGDLRSLVVLPTPGRPKEQQVAAALDQVPQHVDGAEHRPAHPQGQPDHLALRLRMAEIR